MSKAKLAILIVGAGAIGRGFIAPYYSKKYDIYFADCDKGVIEKFSTQNSSYVTAFSVSNGYKLLSVSYQACFDINNLTALPQNISYAFFAVGIKHLGVAAKKIADLCHKNQFQAVYSVENDSDSKLVLDSCFDGICPAFFGVPDVITSSDAPQHLKIKHPLCLVSEQGELYLEGDLLESDASQQPEGYVHMHWLCKKYLHNTPHAALAYLGAQKGYQYIHQSAQDPKIAAITQNIMSQVLTVLSKEFHFDNDFMQAYLDKEWKRFTDNKLYDPILRVGRNPLIKLSSNERIVYVLSLLEKHGLPTQELVKVIAVALTYPHDSELMHIRDQLDLSELITQVTGINSTSQLGKQIIKAFNNELVAVV